SFLRALRTTHFCRARYLYAASHGISPKKRFVRNSEDMASAMWNGQAEIHIRCCIRLRAPVSVQGLPDMCILFLSTRLLLRSSCRSALKSLDRRGNATSE
uniref:RRM domain-containing protein n=1 Tax=Parascaris univalens TaxID=6257 RepID=A0A915A0M1_PARUN